MRKAATPGNEEALKILQSINNRSIVQAVDLERKITHRYGSGCHQKFGVIHIHEGMSSFIHASGWDREGNRFSKDFSEDGAFYDWSKSNATTIDLKDPIFEVQNVEVITNEVANVKPDKRVWVSQTATWFTQAKNDICVEGSFEGFGLKFNEASLQSPVVNRGHK